MYHFKARDLEISAFKVRNKCGIHSRFHSFSENNNRKFSSVTSQVIKAPRSVQSAVTYVTAKQVETATFDGFWKKLWFTVLLMTA